MESTSMSKAVISADIIVTDWAQLSDHLDLKLYTFLSHKGIKLNRTCQDY